MKQIIDRLEAITARWEMLRIDEYLIYLKNWKRRLAFDFISGVARGVGFSVGFTLLGALIIYLLRNAALANLPVIGRFMADLVRIVENNL